MPPPGSKGAIIDELRRDDILPKRLRARVRTYQVARETLEADLRHTPTLSEVAAYLGTTLAETMELHDHAATSTYLVPLSIAGEDPAGSVIGSGGSAIEPSEVAELSAMRDTVKAALLRISERQRQVLVLHYLEGFQKSEIATALGIDRSRVTQLIAQGLRNLRTELGERSELQNEGALPAFPDPQPLDRRRVLTRGFGPRVGPPGPVRRPGGGIHCRLRRGVGRIHVLLADPLQHFLPIDTHLLRCLDAEPDPAVRRNRHDGEDDVVPDEDLLADFAGEGEHARPIYPATGFRRPSSGKGVRTLHPASCSLAAGTN